MNQPTKIPKKYLQPNLQESLMKKHIISSPTRKQDLTFEDLYEEISSDWQEKARKLRVRRMRSLKNPDLSKPYKSKYRTTTGYLNY